MILNNHTFDCVVLEFLHTEFIINRKQVFMELPIDSIQNTVCNMNFFCKLISYKQTNLILFDFGSYLKKLFYFSESIYHKAILLCHIDRSETYKNLAERVIEKDQINSHVMALEVTNYIRLENLLLPDIKLLSKPIRHKLFENGLIGVRFTDDKKIQYFIDVESLAFYCLEKGSQP